MRSDLVALVLSLSWLAACPAGAQSLAQADEAFGRGEIGVAQSAYQNALASGGLIGEELVRAYLRAGVLAMWTGDDAESQRSLRWALTLDPDLAPPPELSPAQQRAFRALRAELAGGPLLEIAVRPGDGRNARVRVSAPSLNGLRVRSEATAEGASRPWQQVREATAEFDLEVPASAWAAALRAHVRVALLDPHGNTLRAARTILRRIASPQAEPPRGEGPNEAPAAATAALASTEATEGHGGGDDTGLIVGVTLAIAAALAGGGAALGYFIWDTSTPETYNLVPASGR